MAGPLRDTCHLLGFDAAAAVLRPLAPTRGAPPPRLTSSELLARLAELEALTVGQAEQARVRRARELVEEQLWP